MRRRELRLLLTYVTFARTLMNLLRLVPVSVMHSTF